MRWVEARPEHRGTDAETRLETARSGQHPIAAVLACANSRVPVEMLFDQGIGELFVVSSAFNGWETTP